MVLFGLPAVLGLLAGWLSCIEKSSDQRPLWSRIRLAGWIMLVAIPTLAVVSGCLSHGSQAAAEQRADQLRTQLDLANHKLEALQAHTIRVFNDDTNLRAWKTGVDMAVRYVHLKHLAQLLPLRSAAVTLYGCREIEQMARPGEERLLHTKPQYEAYLREHDNAAIMCKRVLSEYLQSLESFGVGTGAAEWQPFLENLESLQAHNAKFDGVLAHDVGLNPESAEFMANAYKETAAALFEFAQMCVTAEYIRRSKAMTSTQPVE